ncbi:Pelota-like protein [Thalictrum thalictroides]|uniref:Pelota-like protein n=1 Tax=Thalictrum thalictroides TaxID=46969 RepID=A0A7J6VBC2_THATH|nr:Pelota-like protein [Thalictrum thalictroides]
MVVTVRKVLREGASRGRDAERVKLKLEINVESVDYDKEGSVLRLRGRTILHNEHLKIGQFHTLEIELHQQFVLRKKVWDSLAVDALQEAVNPAATADLAVLMMQKGYGYESALNKFLENVLQAFLNHVDFNVIHCAVIASSDLTHDRFHKYLLLEAERRQLRTIIENKSRILLVPTTSGYEHSLKEVLDAPTVMNLIKDTKAAKEVRALKEFLT